LEKWLDVVTMLKLSVAEVAMLELTQSDLVRTQTAEAGMQAFVNAMHDSLEWAESHWRGYHCAVARIMEL